MKQRTKGIIVAAFFAVILVTSTVTLALNSGPMQNPEAKLTITGTPEDHFPDLRREQFCQSSEAKSNAYVTEYKIPTKCTMPLAVTVDEAGNVWFAQTTTGMVAKFDPLSKKFTEYENPEWTEMTRTMVWGMDYSNGNVWFTDDAHNAIWRFSTQDGTYHPIGFPPSTESLPQHLKIRNNHVVVNDFYGGKISFLDLNQNRTYLNVPSPIAGSFTGGFDFDSKGSVWYTNWMLRQGGALVKFDYAQFSGLSTIPDNSTSLQYSDVFNLPPDLGTPVGLAIDKSDNVWIADTSSSSFFKFDPVLQKFTKYMTSDAIPETYGNRTGVIKTPVTGPYWIQTDGDKIVFNEQIGNAIAVFDTITESLIEYHVPSKNPNWADCGGNKDCGIAQVFGFKAAGDKVWFTEWVENNIGVVDLTKPLPVELSVSQTTLKIPRGQSAQVEVNVSTTRSADISSKTSSVFGDVTVDLMPQSVVAGATKIIPVLITADESALPDTYKILISARTADVTVSQYITVIVTQ